MELRFCHPGFEEAVRSELGIWDRPLTREDALSVTKLELFNFSFLPEDVDALSAFRGLKALDIDIGYTDPAFWERFPELESLYLETWGNGVDFRSFSKMERLSSLTVSGGDLSDMEYRHLEELIPLKRLRRLTLHEFGRADLSPLASMPQLRALGVRYAKDAVNIRTIGRMTWLDELVLDGLEVEDLDFLDPLPDRLRLEMCGIRVRGAVEPERWKRFLCRDICEIYGKNGPFDPADLSALDL